MTIARHSALYLSMPIFLTSSGPVICNRATIARLKAAWTNVERLVDLKLNRHAVAVPSEAALDMVSCLVRIASHDVLNAMGGNLACNEFEPTLMVPARM